MTNITKRISTSELEDLQFSVEYAEYIMEHSGGERVICNGDTLLLAQEDGYLFADFLASLNAE